MSSSINYFHFTVEKKTYLTKMSVANYLSINYLEGRRETIFFTLCITARVTYDVNFSIIEKGK